MHVYETKLGFIDHPRTASRATGKVLLAAGCKVKTGQHQADPKMAKGILDAGGIVACTVRNPFDLMVSWYCNWHFREDGSRKTPGAFETWIHEGHYAGHFLEKDPYFFGVELSNRVLRYETLEQDLRQLMADCGLPLEPLQVIGRTDRNRDYRVYYNWETRRIIQRRFAKDFALTGYRY